jgi:gamma-glutamyltranspeptidase/glutathione hydrolase
MGKVAVATTSQLAADAAAEIAGCGGNAVDCALAAALLSINTEPGVCALAGGAYITVWPTGKDPQTFDGNVTMPGLGRTVKGPPQTHFVKMEYGGGIETMIGAASIAVPGTLAAIELAWQQHGSRPWGELFAASIRATKQGFPLSAASHHYLQYSGTPVFGRSVDGFAALHDAGVLRPLRSTIKVPHLADSLAAIADDGARVFYEGEIAAKIAAHVADNDGLLSRHDLQQYRAIRRTPLKTRLCDWDIACNPPPAIGGAVLSAMILSFARHPIVAWDRDALRRLIRVQELVLSFRKDHLDLSDDVARDVAKLLSLSELRSSPSASASTVHTSAVDDSGLACAITASSGYGSGEMPAGTGLWLNNSVGELELNRKGLGAGPAGARLPSNMSPCVARRSDQVIALGSPGADRITTALHQFLVNFVQLGSGVAEAIAHPRLHFDTSSTPGRVAAEPGLDLPAVDYPVSVFPGLSMYFGGVGAALYDRSKGFEVAADPRREGGTCIAGT